MSENKATREEAFVAWLVERARANDRGTLAALRRGLGKTPGTVPAMYPYIVPWTSEILARNADCFYLVASLFASHPAATDTGNFGTTFRTIASMRQKRTGREPESLSRRFVALLDCNSEELPYMLRQAVALASADDVAINWTQLLRDIRYWEHPDRFVQRKWAENFWAAEEQSTE